ncbi:MAG: PQQ-binding-like beta-propeller repeat protein, partial [Terriglobales bacterium]
LWSYPASGGSSPAVANGVVYVGSTDTNLYALDARTGNKLWSYSPDGALGFSPSVVNGVVYMPTNGYVYAFSLKHRKLSKHAK